MEVIKLSLGENFFTWNLNCDLVPRKINYRRRSAVKTFELSWNPMCDEEGIVRSILVAVKDLTSQLELEDKLKAVSRQNSKMYTMVTEIVSQRVDSVSACFKDTRIRLNRMDLNIHAQFQHDTVFVDLHTLKGSFRTLAFKELSALAHECEDELSRTKGDSEAVLAPFKRKYSEFREEILHYIEVATKVLKIDIDDSSHCYRSLLQISSEALDETIRLASTYGLTLESIVLSDSVIQWSVMELQHLAKILVHAMVNIVDHGYYRPIKGGRFSTTAIRILASASYDEDGNKKIELADEGVGLDRSKLQEFARQNQIEWHSDEELFSVLFADGVSTAEDVSTTSGRGVGLAAVKDIAKALGGTVRIEENKQRGAKLVILLPSRKPAELHSAS